jgi:hypothetical protein
LLNSKAATFFFKTFYIGGELVGKISCKKAFIDRLPIPIPTPIQEEAMNTLVGQIIVTKKQNEDTQKLETEIDKMVFKLYELTETEIKIVEG